MLQAGCDLVSGIAAGLTGHLPDPSPPTPAGITRDRMALLITSTFSSLGSLTVSHRDSGFQVFTWDRTPDATKLGERLTASCAGSFILVGLCLGEDLPSYTTRLVSCLLLRSPTSALRRVLPFQAGGIGIIYS